MRFKEEDLKGMTAKVAGPRPAVARPAPGAAPAVVRQQPSATQVPEPAKTAKEALQALGRMRDGLPNKTEQRFIDEWITPRVLAREIVWWAFEGITLKLAPDCRLTVDFFVMFADGRLQAIDAKGSLNIVSEDAAVKMRVAANQFPFPFFYAVPNAKKQGGGWTLTQVGK